MKAEERKHLKENELADRLGRLWQLVASGSTTNTIIWGVILVGLALIIAWRYYSAATFRTQAAEWSAVERATTVSDLEQIIKDHPGTVVGRITSFHLTRHQMYDALARIASPNSEDRTKAADTLTSVRDRYAALGKDASAEPELVQEALMGVAKAEEVLAAIPKADNPNETRGTLAAAESAYQELARRFPDSYFGKEAAKRAGELDNHRTQIQAFYNGLIEAHAPPKAPPVLSPSPAVPGTAPNPALPEAPKAEQPAAAPADKTSPPAAPPATPPNPPTNPPAGINPAEAPREPKPKAP
jgi:hypothetical protein